ncbi:PEP/pyruvate-binding domain-containing protein [Streptomyces chartreusis]
MLLTGDSDLTDPTAVGHKFARQELLRRAGFPVPEFFCVPATVFDRTVGPVQRSLARPPHRASHRELTAWADAACSRVTALHLPETVTDSALTAFDRLVGPEGLVAVRACVTADASGAGEDGDGDPFAGLSDSFLYVQRQDLLRRIVDCWASVFTPEAVAYRIRRGIDPAAARIAVGVQQMVCGERSFVAFTRDPHDGADRRVIAAAYGIGEGVVQEKADIDHFFVDPDGGVRGELTHKTRMVTLDSVDPAQGAVIAPVPTPQADTPVLDDQVIRRICRLAKEAEEYFGCPQDIEGTITAEGGIHLLQARPIVLGSDTSAEISIAWTNHNVTESFPGVSCALTYSQARMFYETAFADFYRRMGVPRASRHLAHHHLRRMIGYLEGRVYYRLDAWYALHGALPAFDLLRGTWERSLGLTPGEAGQGPRPTRRGTLRALATAPALAVRLAAHSLAASRFLRWWDRLAARQPDPSRQTAEELVTAYRHLWSCMADRWGITLVNSYTGLLSVAATNALLRRWAPTAGEGLLIGLLCGGRENRSLAALRSALALAELLGTQPDLRDAVLHGDERQVWQDLVAGAYGARPAKAAAEHLRRYGDRSPNDLKLEVPTPRQQPWTVLRTVRPLLSQGLTVAASRSKEQESLERARQELRSVCPNRLRRAVLAVALASLRRSARIREDARFCRSQLYGISRQILWRLGDILADTGRLDDRDDVMHLTVEEVLGAFEGTLAGSDVRGLAGHRRTELARYADRAPLPAFFSTSAANPVAAGLPDSPTDTAGQLAAGSVELRGIPSSAGRAHAPAKIVLDPSTPAESCQGRVLVARETDPGWLFLMLAAEGIVVERGSLVSHTAITGRLLGIPTVVAVAGATALIPDGAVVEIDGAAGVVRLAGNGADPR